jgi:hypothetical protein
MHALLRDDDSCHSSKGTHTSINVLIGRAGAGPHWGRQQTKKLRSIVATQTMIYDRHKSFLASKTKAKFEFSQCLIIFQESMLKNIVSHNLIILHLLWSQTTLWPHRPPHTLPTPCAARAGLCPSRPQASGTPPPRPAIRGRSFMTPIIVITTHLSHIHNILGLITSGILLSMHFRNTSLKIVFSPIVHANPWY